MDARNDDNEKLRLGSSNTRDEGPRPRSESTLSDRTLLNMSDSENDEKRRSGDLEKEGLVEQLPKVVTKEHATKDPYARAKILMWMAINTLATVTIVSAAIAPTLTQNPLNQTLNPQPSRKVQRKQSKLTILSSIRSFAIKPSSATNPSHNVKQPSHPSTSSSQQRRSTSSLALKSACLSLARFPS